MKKIRAVSVACVLAAAICLLRESPAFTEARQQAGSTAQPTAKADTTPKEKFVLQVGIQNYDHVPKLKGCLRDLANMKEVLTKRFSVPPERSQWRCNGLRLAAPES